MTRGIRMNKYMLTSLAVALLSVSFGCAQQGGVSAQADAKPAVSTVWRGIPSVVTDQHSGFLVPVQQPEAVASRLLALRDPELRHRMGQEGRRIFEREFTLNAFHHHMEQEFIGLFP